MGVECNTTRFSLHKESTECENVHSFGRLYRQKKQGLNNLTFSQVEGVRRGDLIIYLLIQGTECCSIIKKSEMRGKGYSNPAVT